MKTTLLLIVSFIFLVMTACNSEKKESKIEKIKDIEVTEKKKEHVKEQTIDIKEVKKDKFVSKITLT